jgi:hypothetical protein
MSNKLSTKSRFRIVCEWPTKLFFTSTKEYGSTKADNAFLKMLKIENGRTRAETRSGTNANHLGAKPLKLVPLSEKVEFLLTEWKWEEMSFEKLTHWLSSAYKNYKMLAIGVGAKCKNFLSSSAFLQKNTHNQQDTLAMVMIFEYWKDVAEGDSSQGQAA